jgi:geranylgeranyl reductase family protein
MAVSRFLADVAVVGAGPAGSRTARQLARYGLRVLLIEEHREVGIPSHCSGLISPRTWEMGEVEDQELVCNRLRGAILQVEDGTSLALGSQEVRALAIDRVAWDRALAHQAYEAGAEPVRARFLAAEPIRGGLRLHLQRDSHPMRADVRLLVGADGVHSRVARSLGLPRPREKVLALGVEARIHLPREDYVYVFVGPRLAPGWFAWAIPSGPGLARLGIGCLAGQGTPMELYRAFKEGPLAPFGPVREVRFYGGAIPLTPVPRTYGHHVLLVGDAAGQVKPFSGGGLYPGLMAASLCAEAAWSAFQRDDLSASSLAQYEREWRRRLGRELARSWHLRRAGLCLDTPRLAALVRALSHPRLQALATQHADIDYPSRALLALARHALPPLLGAALGRPAALWHLVAALLARG